MIFGKKKKLEKIWFICQIEAEKCENYLSEYEKSPSKPTKAEAAEREGVEDRLEILGKIIDIIE
jgi:hypothetical protein